MGTLPDQLKVKALFNLWVCFTLRGSLGGLSDQSWQKDGGPASEHSQGPIG